MKAVPLSEVCCIVNGGTPKSGIADYWEGDVAWLTPAEMGKRRSPFIGQTARTITQAGLKNSSARQVPVGAVIMSTRAPIGHLAIPEVPMAFNQGCRGLVPNERLHTKYLYYFLFFSREALNDLGTGATFKELSSSALGKFQIPLPSLEEQRRIVALLDGAFAAIATAAANVEKNLANARELFACELRKIFTFESKNWVRKRLLEVAKEFGRGKSRHRPRGDPKLYGSTAPLIQTGDVSNADHWLDHYTQMYSELGVSQSKLWPKGTVCVAIVGANVGESAILNFDACFPDSVIGIVPNDEESHSEYIEYLLQFYKRDLKEKGKGTARDNINIETFENLLMPFPDLSTQRQIVARLNAATVAVGELVNLIEAKQAALDELKQSLLQRAFAGELITVTAAANEKWKAPEFTAHVIALAYRCHLATGTEATFGRVKAQKTLHLCESVGGVDLGRNPIKDAAGPNDFQHMLAAEDWARTNQFFEFVPRPSGNGYSLKKLARFNALVAEGAEALQPAKDRLERAISLVASMNSEEAELLATVHAAWNNLLLDGVEATETAIIHEARENWHVAKKKFGDGKFRQAIATIRAKGIEPDGSAKRVGGQEAMLF